MNQDKSIAFIKNNKIELLDIPSELQSLGNLVNNAPVDCQSKCLLLQIAAVTQNKQNLADFKTYLRDLAMLTKAIAEMDGTHKKQLEGIDVLSALSTILNVLDETALVRMFTSIVKTLGNNTIEFSCYSQIVLMLDAIAEGCNSYLLHMLATTVHFVDQINFKMVVAPDSEEQIVTMANNHFNTLIAHHVERSTFQLNNWFTFNPSSFRYPPVPRGLTIGGKFMSKSIVLSKPTDHISTFLRNCISKYQQEEKVSEAWATSMFPGILYQRSGFIPFINIVEMVQKVFPKQTNIDYSYYTMFEFLYRASPKSLESYLRLLNLLLACDGSINNEYLVRLAGVVSELARELSNAKEAMSKPVISG